MAVRRADAVRSCIASADDHYVLASGPEILYLAVAGNPPVLQRQEIHGEMDAVKIASRHGQVARLLCAPRQDHGVEFIGYRRRIEHLCGGVSGTHGGRADKLIGPEFNALGMHLGDAAVDEAFLHLEIRDPVAKQSADSVVFLEQHDAVPRARKLLGGGEPCGARADHRNALA